MGPAHLGALPSQKTAQGRFFTFWAAGSKL